MRRNVGLLTLLTVIALGLFAAQDVAAHAITGAIWTSEDDGVQVNGNLYDAKADVYLNGGPIHEGAAGLPPADKGPPPDFDTYYVFQVTDPSGMVLLSQDEARCRVFTVGGNAALTVSSIA